MDPRSGRAGAVTLALLIVLSPACGKEDRGGAGGGGARATDADCNLEEVTTESGLRVRDLECGEGAEAVAGKTVSVHYVGTLESGERFDSSRDRGQPFEFTLGADMVIAGWDEGVAGMRVGGLRELTIPPELGYGAQGAPPVIPADATLLFEIELLEVTV